MTEEKSNPTELDELLGSTFAQPSSIDIGFTNWKAVSDIFRRMASKDRNGLSEIYPFLMAAFGSAADPDRSIVNFERFLESYGPGLFPELAATPRVIEILVTLFSASPFLTEILLRTPDALKLLNDRKALTERQTIEQFQSEALSASLQFEEPDEKLGAVRRYQRQQFLRIGTSDFLGLFDLQLVFSQLSRMAIGMIRACLSLAARQTGIAPGELAIIALGKLGGWELNYSSDIDLIFVAKSKPEKYHKLAEQLVKNISSTTVEGFLYRVDLRLRPWGNDGPLITTPEVFLEYIQNNARIWEKQALIKARAVAGTLAFAEELRKKIEPFLFSVPFEEVRSSIYSMKQRTEQYLREKGRYWGEVKLGAGSIRDVEFIVQYLQMTHPAVRTRATLKAIHQLSAEGLLSPLEEHILKEGYSFLRTIEHYLQMIDYRQTYTLPSDPVALSLLARRFGFESSEAGKRFVESYEQHCHAIRSIFLKYIGNETADKLEDSMPEAPLLFQHLARMDASYTATFSSQEIKKQTDLVNKINNNSSVIVAAEPLDEDQWRVTIVGYDQLGELSLICGLMFVYGLDIVECQAFTYEPENEIEYSGENLTGTQKVGKRKIVDVFTVRSTRNETLTQETWSSYQTDLQSLLMKMQVGLQPEARGELVRKVGEVFQGSVGGIPPLYPIEIEIDNNLSNSYTVLKISTTDTVGFLFEFSNALALNRINIARMFVQSVGKRVNDTIYVTNDNGNKITSPEKLRELRAATVLIKHFTHLLPLSPNPESALLHFGELMDQLFQLPDWPNELVNLERPEVLDALARLLGVSDFLWDDFLRMQYSNLFPVVKDVRGLEISKDRTSLQDALKELLEKSTDWRTALNAFKDREMFRIDMRHILGYTPEFWGFSYELTDLVEVVLTAAYEHCKTELSMQYGFPLLEKGMPCPIVIAALGKCGGRELGFASDIELMLLYGGQGSTSGPRVISTSDFFDELVRALIVSIQARQEGIFHIDLQLRPYGKAGSLAVSIDSFERYFAPQGPAWAYERQALVKLRPIIGDRSFGEKVCTLRDKVIYGGEPFDVTAMRAMRERQIRHLVSAGRFNAKFSSGGLVDIEYLVQGLQITYGANHPSLRSTNIRTAMAALAELGILTENDYGRLRKAHTFMSWLIESLRVVRGNTKDVNIPQFDSDEFSFLARRLRYGRDTMQLKEDLTRYSVDVQELNQRLLLVSK
jgi:[glutamine synthetase] adenylyltransferase / [glutamine synthetase]-adenylyl-L-tyrosine phosphorylase